MNLLNERPNWVFQIHQSMNKNYINYISFTKPKQLPKHHLLTTSFLVKIFASMKHSLKIHFKCILVSHILRQKHDNFYILVLQNVGALH